MHEIRKSQFVIAYETIEDLKSMEAERLLSADFTLIWIGAGKWKVTIEGNTSRARAGTLVMKRSEEQVVLRPSGSGERQLFMIGVWGRIPRQEGFPSCADLYDRLLARPVGRDNVFSRAAVAQQVLSAPVWHLMTLDVCGYSDKIKEELAIKNVYHILTDLCRLLPDQQPEELYQSVVKQIKAYVDMHLSEKLTAKRLGKIFFLSPNYLMAIFKAEIGLSLHQYITERRIDHAERLMRQGMGVTQVGYQVGYKSYQGFYQAYYRYTGRNPADFIAEVQKSNGEESIP